MLEGRDCVNATDNGGNSVFATVVADAVQNGGSDGGLYWGRWTGTNVTVSAGLNTALANRTFAIPASSSVHYVLGTSVPTTPGTGTATYSFIGGTPSTDQAGGVGLGITNGGLTAFFNQNRVGASMTVVHGGTYTLFANMPFDSNRAVFRLTTSPVPPFTPGSASTTGAGPPAKVSGFFAGTNSPTAPSRAGISYTIQAPSPIVGVGAFGCRTGC